jgi:hypothetical protein
MIFSWSPQGSKKPQSRRAPQAMLVAWTTKSAAFLLPCPKGCPAKAASGGVAHPRRATSPAVVCALHLPPWRGNGHHEKSVNRF